MLKAMIFPVVMQECESWTIRKAEWGRIDAFEQEAFPPPLPDNKHQPGPMTGHLQPSWPLSRASLDDQESARFHPEVTSHIYSLWSD